MRKTLKQRLKTAEKAQKDLRRRLHNANALKRTRWYRIGKRLRMVK